VRQRGAPRRARQTIGHATRGAGAEAARFGLEPRRLLHDQMKDGVVLELAMEGARCGRPSPPPDTPPPSPRQSRARHLFVIPAQAGIASQQRSW